MILGIPPDFDSEYDINVTSPQVNIVSDEARIIRMDTFEFNELNKKYTSDIDFVTSRIQQALNLQTREVEDIINKEKERIRREEELQRKQEQEIKRKQEEERKRKEEEERKRKEEEEKQRKAEEERKRKEQEEKLRRDKELKEKEAIEKKQKEEEAEAKKKQQEEANSALKTEKEFLEYKEKIKFIKDNIVNKVNEDKDLKKAIGPVRRKINPRFGQLSNSKSQLANITSAICEMVGQVRSNDMAYKFILNFIAKAIVSQAETEIVAQPNAALPLAMLSSNLLNTFPELNEYLMPRLVKKCPIIIGYTCSSDTEQGRINMGWKRNKSTGKWEESDKYDERIASICSLFSVLTKLGNQYYPISMSWAMLAKICNTDRSLVTNVHYFCIANWWECCGKHFINTYKTQAVKLMQLLAFELTKDQKFPAATRLKILGEEGIHPNINTIKDMEI